MVRAVLNQIAVSGLRHKRRCYQARRTERGNKMLSKRILSWLTAAMLTAACVLAQAQADKTPDVLIQEVSTEVLDAVRADKSIKQGDVQPIIALVDAKVMPHVDFRRMTASAVGRYWRQATPEQQKRLQDEFKLLLVRTYSGALAQVQDQTVELKPMRSAPTDNEVVVKTEVRAAATRSSSTTGSRRRPAAGRSTTSTCSACGWSRTTATASRRRSATAASTA